MITDKVIIISLAFYILIYLAIKFVKCNTRRNLIIIPFQSFFIGAYIAKTTYNINYNLVYDIISAVFMIIIPSILFILQYNNIHVREKLLMLKMDLNYVKKNYKETIIICNRLLSMNILNSKILYFLGKSYDAEKDFVKARDSFARAVEVNRKDYKSYYEFAKILNDTNKLEVAVIMYNNCLRIKPDFFEATDALSMLYCTLEQYDKALETYKEALRYHPNLVEAYYNMGVIYTELRRLDEAKVAFAKAAELRPKLYGANYNIGQIYYLSGDYDKAIEYFNKARSSTMYGAKAYYYLAKVYMARNENKKAISHLEYAMELEPSYIFESQNEMIFSGIIDFIKQYIEAKVDTVNNVNNMSAEMEKRRKMEKIIEADIEREKQEELQEALNN